MCAWATSVFAQDVAVQVTPDNDALRVLLREASLTATLTDTDDAQAQDYVAAARADYRRLLTALYSRGFYGGTISIRLDGREAASIAPLDAPARISAVTINVIPGPRFTFGQAEIAPLPPAAELPETFAPGEMALSDAIREGVSAGVDAWREAGHAKARPASQQITARHAEAVLDASVTIAPGPRLTFGPLAISGQSAVRETAIRRIAGLPVGEVYSPAELDKVARRLRQTGAFDSVSLTEAENIGPNDTLPIELQLLESKPRRIGFGLELSSIEGLQVSSFWMHRNAFGGAERFRIDAEIAGIGGFTGGVDYSLGASLGVPAVYGPDTDFLATARISREDEPDYLIDAITLEASVTRILRDDLTAEVGIGLLSAREERDGDVREYTLLTLPLGMTLDRRNSATNASSGYYIDVGATPFISITGADNGAQLTLDTRAYRSLGAEDTLTFAARGQLGSVLGAEATAAPADFLFASGGGGTVRGQGYKSLTAQPDGTGGLSFAGAQLEARYTVRENVSLVGFYDVGYVGRSSTPLTDGDWHAGTGLGLRYETGIGPIRLDIGTPANGDDAFGSVQVYIGIGQSF